MADPAVEDDEVLADDIKPVLLLTSQVLLVTTCVRMLLLPQLI